VHVYLHDTDLMERRRRALVSTLLPLLARRATPTDLDSLASSALSTAPEARWEEIARDAL
jgi:hypothetical protein